MDRKKKILIVDDDEIIAEMLTKTLQKLDYDVVGVADSGEKAVEEAVNQHPDLVIMDIVLAGKINGIEASHQIDQFLNVPVIFMTGHRNVAAAMHANNRVPLLKPFTKEDLTQAVELALSLNNT